jgi:hypothetical protein
MGLLNFLKPKNEQLNQTNNSTTTQKLENVSLGDDSETSTQERKEASPEIPEHIFVEYAKPKSKSNMEPNETPQEINNLQTLYTYLAQNLEKKGYEDALMNPDSSYRDEYVRYIQNELNLMISKVNTYYYSHLRTIDLHIDTRKRGGMLELVDELETERKTVEDEMKVVAEIENDSKKSTGLTENLFLSYKRGFMNGFAAITYNTVLKR